MSNPFIFHEIITSDATASKAYFQTLFNWNLQPVQGGELIIIENILPGQAPAGLITQAEQKPGYKPGPLFYIQVDSIDIMQEKIGALGGKTLLPKMTATLKDYDYQLAVFTDPQGNQFGLMETVTQGGTPVNWFPTQFAFNEIITPNPGDLVASFYCALFEWQAVLNGPEAPAFFEISTHEDLISQAGIGKTSDMPGFNQYASFYVQVLSATDVLEKAISLGGSEVMPPTPVTLDDVPYDIAMFRDPLGENQIGLISSAVSDIPLFDQD